ncbi:MAG: ArsR/SmtB family transcription factor [Candidatus Heimdallarchaeota archaeon]
MESQANELERSLRRAKDFGCFPEDVSVEKVIQDLETKRDLHQLEKTKNKFRDFSNFFKAMSNSKRLEIIALLADRERCVCELQPVLGISTPSISQHLKILQNIGIVSTEKKGQFSFARLNQDKIMEINMDLKEQLLGMTS